MNTALKLQLTFQSLNHLTEFYTTKIGKTQRQALTTICTLGCKGMIITNPDETISVTWFFRTKGKYDKFIARFLEFTASESYYQPQHVKREVYY